MTPEFRTAYVRVQRGFSRQVTASIDDGNVQSFFESPEGLNVTVRACRGAAVTPCFETACQIGFSQLTQNRVTQKADVVA
jgi:hypothetical protein